MQKIPVKYLRYRDVLFTNKSFKNSDSFFIVNSFSFLYVETQTKDTAYKLRHGYVGGFTQNKRRKIKLEFGAIAKTEEQRRDLIKQVNKLFEPPHNPNFTDKRGYYPMWFIAVDGIEREFNAKAINRPQETDIWHKETMDFKVELIVEDGSCIFGKTRNEINDRNYIRWVSFPSGLPISFSSYPSADITYTGTSTANVKCTITAIQDNATTGTIQIMSIRGWDFTRMYFNINLNNGDVLVINPTNNQVLLNDVDITWDLELSFGNNYPILVEDNNPQKLVVDTWKPTKTVDVKREYRDTRC